MNLSIIIPHYNCPELLELLLQSIYQETDQAEVIVVDDHSDKMLEKYSSVQQSYSVVKYYSNDEGKKGAGSARNVGLRHAKGKRLLFADADDVFLPGWYNVVSEYFETEYDIVFFPPNGRGGKKKLERQQAVRQFSENHDRESEHILRYKFFSPCNKLFSKKMIDKNQISFEDVRYGNDVMFSVMCGSKADNIAADQRNIYRIVQREGSLSTAKTEESCYIKAQVSCRAYCYARRYLSKEDLNHLYGEWPSLVFLNKVIKRKYGFASLIKFYRLFRKNRIPVFSRIIYRKNK